MSREANSGYIYGTSIEKLNSLVVGVLLIGYSSLIVNISNNLTSHFSKF